MNIKLRTAKKRTETSVAETAPKEDTEKKCTKGPYRPWCSSNDHKVGSGTCKQFRNALKSVRSKTLTESRASVYDNDI